MQKKLFVCLLILALTDPVLIFASGGSESGFSMVEDASSIRIQTALYSINITKSPFQICAYNELGSPVLKSERSGFERGGRHYDLTEVTDFSVDEENNEVDLSIKTTMNGRSAMLGISLEERFYRIWWRLDDNGANGWMGDSYLLSSGGHWYGQGELFNQVFPLDKTSIPSNTAVDFIRGFLPQMEPLLAPVLGAVSGPFYRWIAPLILRLPYQYLPLNSYIAMLLSSASADLMTRDMGMNVNTPFWLTSSGAGIFAPTYDPMTCSINEREDGLFRIGFKDSARIDYIVIPASNTREVFEEFVSIAGRPGRAPPFLLLEKPIWSTWAEYKKDVDQERVLSYARSIVESGFPYSVMEIDDRWQTHYGDMDFDPEKFSDPKSMVDELHRMGFRVTLWVMPFVSVDSGNFREGMRKGYFVKDPVTGLPLLVSWWSVGGIATSLSLWELMHLPSSLIGSALLDLSNPEALEWFYGKLRVMQEKYGIDGFKFDAGEASYFPKDGVSYGDMKPCEYSDAWVELARRFELSETRTGWLAQEHGGLVREYDKSSDWGLDNGLHAVLTQALSLSMVGYPYVLPDMIGGNAYAGGVSKELFIRWTQMTAFMPAMQFSIPPWRFDSETVDICRNFTLMHKALAPYIYEAAMEAKDSGTPILRPLFFDYPEDEGAYSIDDEYMFGELLLVAPVLEDGARSREVYIPPGLWQDLWSNTKFAGPATITISAPLDRIPVLIRVEGS